jgi:hypothetical protein
MAPDIFAICCNHSEGSGALAGSDGRNQAGAQCWYSWTTGGADGRANMVCRSRGGRWIETWVAYKKTARWRVKFLPPPLRDHNIMKFASRDEAQAELEMLGRRGAPVI